MHLTKNITVKITFKALFSCHAVTIKWVYMSLFLNYLFGYSFAALFEIIHK